MKIQKTKYELQTMYLLLKKEYEAMKERKEAEAQMSHEAQKVIEAAQAIRAIWVRQPLVNNAEWHVALLALFDALDEWEASEA